MTSFGLPPELLRGALDTVKAAHAQDYRAMEELLGGLEAEHGPGNVLLSLYWVIGLLLGDVCRRTGLEAAQVIGRLADDVVSGPN